MESAVASPVLLDGRRRELIDSDHRYLLLSTENGTKDTVQLLLVFNPSPVSYLMLFLGHNLAFQFSLQGPDNAASNEDRVLLLPSLRLEGFLLNCLFFLHVHTGHP